MLDKTYTPTFLEKVLGRRYKWWYLVFYSFKQTNLRLSGFLLGNFASTLDFLITIYLWFLIEPTKERITYLVISFILQRLVWSQYASFFAEEIFYGKLANRLIIPVSTMLYWLFRLALNG